MKRGVKRIKANAYPVDNAAAALRYLRKALDHAKAAGSCYTAARIRYAISSAKGAVRAAHYREAKR